VSLVVVEISTSDVRDHQTLAIQLKSSISPLNQHTLPIGKETIHICLITVIFEVVNTSIDHPLDLRVLVTSENALLQCRL
jgi:hypothetical protein